MSKHVCNTNSSSTEEYPPVKPFPKSTEDFYCHEIQTPEGVYKLMHEIYFKKPLPQFYEGTHVTTFCPTTTANSKQFLTIPTDASTTASSFNSSSHSSVNEESIAEDTGDNNSSGTSFSHFFSYKHHRHSRKKPKSSLSKLKSSFIDYTIPHEQLSSRPSVTNPCNIFFNIGYHLFFMDEHQQPKVKRSLKGGRTRGRTAKQY